jgi:hypothetical protein
LKYFSIPIFFFASQVFASTMAIAVLFTPDEENLQWVSKINKEIHDRYPQGYRFDDSHLAHVAILQTYVDISCLDEKWDAIEKEVKASRLIGEKMNITGIKSSALPSPSPLSLVNLNLSASGRVSALQNKLLVVLAPCRVETENPKAFAGLISPEDYIISHVKNYSIQNTKDLYHPHLTLGIVPTADAQRLSTSSAPLTTMTVKRVGVFKLGAHGTARERLFSYDK